MSFERIKAHYEAGRWNLQMIRMAVRKGVITKDQFKEITGVDY